MRLMICGSRDAAPALEAYAVLCVKRAVEQGYLLLVGDALGVDGAVCEAAKKQNAACFVYGIQSVPRNGGARNPRSIYINLNDKRYAGEVFKQPGEVTYADRDQYLVRHANIIVCIWNGLSQESGTYKVYDYARQWCEQHQPRQTHLNKKVMLVTLENEQCRIVNA